MGDEYVWHKACDAAEIDEDEVVEVTIEGKPYALFRISAGYFATDGRCTHEQAPLADGFVSGDTVECARHNARFHIPTGKAIRRPASTDLTVYPVKVEEDRIHIGLPADE